MKDDRKLPYCLRNFLQVYKQIISALKFFEEKEYVHRDIKREFYFLCCTMKCVYGELHGDGKIMASKTYLAS